MVAPLAGFAVSAALGLAKGIAGQVAGSPAAKPSAEASARKTSQDFESMFLEDTVDRMFATAGPDGPLGDNGTGGAVYRSMLAKQYAGTIAKSGGVGIADQVYREILRLQEGRP